jgi:hypothetical protein
LTQSTNKCRIAKYMLGVMLPAVFMHLLAAFLANSHTGCYVNEGVGAGLAIAYPLFLLLSAASIIRWVQTIWIKRTSSELALFGLTSALMILSYSISIFSEKFICLVVNVFFI